MPEKSRPCKLGMVFGVFDGLHPGHQNFLLEAAQSCEKLVVVVARTSIVRKLKGHAPRHGTRVRMNAIRGFLDHAHIVPSDRTIGKWRVLRDHSPDIVFLGYDQERMAESLTQIKQPFKFLSPHQPKRFKSSLLHTSEEKKRISR